MPYLGYANLVFEAGGPRGQSGGTPGGMGLFNFGPVGQVLYGVATVASLILTAGLASALVKSVRAGLRAVVRLAALQLRRLIPAARAAIRWSRTIVTLAGRAVRGLVVGGSRLAARGFRGLLNAYRVWAASRWRSVALSRASLKELELWEAVLHATRVAIGRTLGGRGHLYAALATDRIEAFILDVWLKAQGITWTTRRQRVFNRALFDRGAIMGRPTHIMAGRAFTLDEVRAAEAGARASGTLNVPYWPGL